MTHKTDTKGHVWSVWTLGEYVVGVGRKGWACGPVKAVDIGRPSKYGNPFKIVGIDHDGKKRADAIGRYYAALVKRPAVCRKKFAPLVSLLRTSKKIALLCHCAPEGCHGDVIARAVLALACESNKATTK